MLDTIFAEGVQHFNSCMYKSAGSPHCHNELLAQLGDVLMSADLAPLYETFCQELGWNQDASQLKRMQTANQEKLQQLKAAIKDADENLGETEVKEALTGEADYLNRIGELPQPTQVMTASMHDEITSDMRLVFVHSCI